MDETSALMTWKSVTDETGQTVSVRILDPVAPYPDNQVAQFCAVVQNAREVVSRLWCPRSTARRIFGWNFVRLKGQCKILTVFEPAQFSLASRLTQLDATMKRKALYSVADALQMLHVRNCMHRDLTADNVLFCGERPVLGGFFSATSVHQVAHSNDREKDLFLPPERRAGQTIYRTPTDIWYFGILIWEILEGQHRRTEEDKPFEEVRTRYMPWSPEYQGFEELVAQMHAVNPDHRPKIETVIEWIVDDQKWPPETWEPFQAYLEDAKKEAPPNGLEDQAFEQFMRLAETAEELCADLNDDFFNGGIQEWFTKVMEILTGMDGRPFSELGNIMRRCQYNCGFNDNAIRGQLDELSRDDGSKGG
jgi:serine/threonine protein kinase